MTQIKIAAVDRPDAPEDEESETSVNPIELLMARMDAHDAELELIDAELVKHGLTRKKVNSIRATKRRLAKEQAMLANLTGATG